MPWVVLCWFCARTAVQRLHWGRLARGAAVSSEEALLAVRDHAYQSFGPTPTPTPSVPPVQTVLARLCVSRSLLRARARFRYLPSWCSLLLSLALHCCLSPLSVCSSSAFSSRAPCLMCGPIPSVCVRAILYAVCTPLHPVQLQVCAVPARGSPSRLRLLSTCEL